VLTCRDPLLIGAALTALLIGTVPASAVENRPSSDVYVRPEDGKSVRTETESRLNEEIRRPGMARKKRLELPGLRPIVRALGPEEDGRHLRNCSRDQYPHSCTFVPLPPLPPNAPARQRRAAVTVRDLVLRAVNLLRLPAPDPEIRPTVRFHDGAVGGLTGAPLWLWIPRQQWRTLHQRTQAGTAWAEVTAAPISQTWTFGDQSKPLYCDTPGTEITQLNAHRALEGSPSCGYTYTVSSRHQPKQQYAIQVTVNWQVSWTGSGDTAGTLPLMRRAQTIPYTVRQARAQLVDPDN
jgi:hypothetical protein